MFHSGCLGGVGRRRRGPEPVRKAARAAAAKSENAQRVITTELLHAYWAIFAGGDVRGCPRACDPGVSERFSSGHLAGRVEGETGACRCRNPLPFNRIGCRSSGPSSFLSWRTPIIGCIHFGRRGRPFRLWRRRNVVVILVKSSYLICNSACTSREELTYASKYGQDYFPAMPQSCRCPYGVCCTLLIFSHEL